MSKLSLVINQDGVKRKLEGPFAICVGRDSLLTLRSRLNEIDMDSFAYGWITIYEKPTIEPVVN